MSTGPLLRQQRNSPKMNQISSPWFKEPRLDTDFESEIPNFYGISDRWTSLPQWTDHSVMPIDDNFSGTVPFTASNVSLPLAQGPSSVGSVFRSNIASDSTSQSQRVNDSSGAQASTILSTTSSMPEPSLRLQDMTTVSPLQTCYDIENPPPSSNASLCSRRLSDSNEEPNHSMTEFERSTVPTQAQHGGVQDASEMPLPTKKHRKGGRKRSSEPVEPGSARSIYLDKNRKAASKCRRKQKEHEEDLVELARNVERKNKVLKVEAAILRDSKQELLNMVAQHVNCPNSRMGAYLQREADRIAFEADSYSRLHTQSADSASPTPDA
jgi:cyclic AMP-dependent transcription factor ATF-2